MNFQNSVKCVNSSHPFYENIICHVEFSCMDKVSIVCRCSHSRLSIHTSVIIMWLSIILPSTCKISYIFNALKTWKRNSLIVCVCVCECSFWCKKWVFNYSLTSKINKTIFYSKIYIHCWNWWQKAAITRNECMIKVQTYTGIENEKKNIHGNVQNWNSHSLSFCSLNKKCV